jgi:serine/threonine protein kinase
MGACFSDCYYAYFASDYETIPEEVSEWNKMPTSPASSTGFGYQSDGTVPSNRSSDNALPHSFLSSYIMGELIGVGTTAEVFRVAYKQADGSPDHQRPLVCKVIDKRGITYSIEENDPSPALQQLWREVEILKRIRHPNIVAYYDYMETKDRLYIITERLEGGELFDYISNNGPLTEDLACQILYGVFSAVAYLHERGVVHRDIKAENLIFFRDSYNQVSLKLIDFGFSTIVDRQAAGTFLGTGGYIAPEIRQNKDYTTSVDMWSLGVLLYCSLSARLPFGISLDTLPDEIDACRQTFDLQFPQKLFGRVSAPCIRLITQLLEVDPARRLSASEALHHPWVSDVALGCASCGFMYCLFFKQWMVLWTAVFGCEALDGYHKQALVTKIHGTLLVLT